MIRISDSVYSVGVLNPNLRVFDIVMKTEYGTSYNSFLIKGEKNVLIETCHEKYFDEYMEHIGEVISPAEIDYIILNHTEPDHSGSLARLLDAAPRAEIVCSQAASIYLRGITNRADLKLRVAKDGDTLDIGGGKKLAFTNAPFLHWPDSMFTWFEAEKTLFSCDFFGSHYCEPRMIDTAITHPKAYWTAFRGYYDAIFGPFKPYVLGGLEKIKDLDVETVCTSHGPVLTAKGLLPEVKELYREWSQPHVNAVKTIPIFYCTAYGNTGLAAGAIREGILEVIPDAKIDLYDLIEHAMADCAGALAGSDAFLIGSPTINRDAVPPVWELLAHVDLVNNQKKPVAVFGSFGWSGEAVPAVMNRLNTMKLAVFGDGFKFNFVPSGEELEKARQFGRDFAASLK